MHYASPKREHLYRNLTRGRGYRPHTLAALFLLTARRKLWKRWCAGAVSNAGIDWTAGRDIETGWDGFYLERAARSIAGQEENPITLHNLLSHTDYPTELILLVLTALLLARGERVPKSKQKRRQTC